MKCSYCNEHIGGSIAVKVCGKAVCKECVGSMEMEMAKMAKESFANEILAYMHRSAGTRTPEEIVNECAEKYAPEDVLDAKAYLLNKHGGEIKGADAKVHGEIFRKRIDSHGRKAIIANLHDILVAFVVLDGIQCDGSALNDVEDSLVVSDNVESATLESRVAQLEMKFSLIDSLNAEKEKLRSDNSKLHNENAMQKIAIDDLMAKVASLEAEVVALKRCNDENGLTRWKTINGGLNSVSHGPGETPKDEGVTNDTTTASKHAKQASTRISGNLKHQRNLRVTHASSMMAAQAAAMGMPADNATAIGNFAASTVAKSLSFAQVAAVPRSDTSKSRNDEYPPLPRRGRRPGLSRTRPYKVGAGENIGLAASKPSWFTNKTLVIAGIDKGFLNNKKGIKEKIDILAGRPITIHHMAVLSREVKGRAFDWLTVAVELSVDDFTHLLNLDTWESGIRIREFVGRRFWRQNKITKEDRQSSIRMQWR